MLLTSGSFLFIQPSAQACHSLSRHIGVPSASTRHIQPLVPARSCLILPSADISMIVAPLETDAGAALIAREILALSEPPSSFFVISCPDLALGSSLAFSWATTVTLAMIKSPPAITITFRIASLRAVVGLEGMPRLLPARSAQRERPSRGPGVSAPVYAPR